MKQWSGWAHTLRTKESRRKPDKNTVNITEKKKDIGNKEYDKYMESKEKKGNRTREIKRMKKDETGVINVNKIEMEDEETEKKVNEVDVEKEGGGDRVKSEGRDEGDEGVEENEDEGEGEEEGKEQEQEQEQDEHAPPKDQHNTNRPTDITYGQMAETGKKVKRILDHGRVKFLKHLGLRASQIKYCHPSLSPECIMIVADRQ
jgi:Methyltransferase TRM13